MSSAEKGLKVYTPEELREQRKVIVRVLKVGTPEELAILETAEKDPELHPQIRRLIEECRGSVGCEGREEDNSYALPFGDLVNLDI